MTIATLPKIRPRTIYINTNYWRFREHLQQGKITIYPVSTKDQIADLLTKLLLETDFEKLKHRIMGEEHSDVFKSMKGSVEINNGGQIPGLKELAVMGDEKQESTKVRFKNGANSASPNSNQLEESNTDRRTQQGSNAVKRLKD